MIYLDNASTTKPSENVKNAVMDATEKTAIKSAMKATAAEAGEKIVEITQSGSTAKETLLAVNKAYDDTFDAIMKWGDKHLPQLGKTVDEITVYRAAEKFMETKSGKAIAKQIEKKIGKEVAASIAKKLPIVCLGIGAVRVYDRLKEGEYAVASNFPGLGTLASVGIDSVMLCDDLKMFESGIARKIAPTNPNNLMLPESTFVKNLEMRQELMVRKLDNNVETKGKETHKLEKKNYQYIRKPDNYLDR